MPAQSAKSLPVALAKPLAVTRLRDLLTVREFGLVTLLAEGKKYGQIAREVGLAYGTVKNTFKQILDKSGMSDQLELVNRYMSEEPPDPDEMRVTGGELTHALTAKGATGIIIFAGQRTLPSHG